MEEEQSREMMRRWVSQANEHKGVHLVDVWVDTFRCKRGTKERIAKEKHSKPYMNTA